MSQGVSTARGQRLRLRLEGIVQGTGFRPFVYRLARSLELGGWVRNSDDGVTIEVEGPEAQLKVFRKKLSAEAPAASAFGAIRSWSASPVGQTVFEIGASRSTGTTLSHLTPDLATCRQCLREMSDPENRRFRYPFIGCTECGPRYSILLGLPWDRSNTTMRNFELCERCRREFEDPCDRRFHAQPIACPDCGPELEQLDSKGRHVAYGEEALTQTVAALRHGKIVAIKGLGGFHLFVDARNPAAVDELRRRKRREEKPFAVMYPTLSQVRRDCEVADAERALLCSNAAPIVLLKPRQVTRLAPSVAASSSEVGVLLPYTPLHHMLTLALGFPIVATSGNYSTEPLCIDERQAVSRLGNIADVLLVHNREIAHAIDDSVARILCGQEQVLRRGRGYAPATIPVSGLSDEWLALGGHLKNTVAVSTRDHVLLSTHIGDLDNAETHSVFQRTIAELAELARVKKKQVAVDAHPDYLSTRYAEALDMPVSRIQHHYAHVQSCMADNELDAPLLGVAWDGGGRGDDGSVWGGEFLSVERDTWVRAAHLDRFSLPGGSRAIREPWRIALGLLESSSLSLDRLRIPDSVTPSSRRQQVETIVRTSAASVPTSSVGRLFDAVASMAGIRHRVSFEGQAAMELEGAIDGLQINETYQLDLVGQSPIVVDWRPMVRQLIDDVEGGVSRKRIACRFHNALVEVLVQVAMRVGLERVVLTGGCFQNRYLSERSVESLRKAGFRPYWHHRVPPNDGGLAVGQLTAAARQRLRCV